MRVALALAVHAAIGMATPAAAAPGAAARADTLAVRAGSDDGAPRQSGFAPGLPLKRDAADDVVGPGRAALAAGGILLIAVWAAVQYRKRQRGVARKAGPLAFPWLGHLLPDAQARQLSVVETATLAPHAKLHVVTWKGREYLVSTAPDHVRVLDRREIPADQAQDQSPEAR
jgi:hypothetical protein